MQRRNMIIFLNLLIVPWVIGLTHNVTGIVHKAIELCRWPNVRLVCLRSLGETISACQIKKKTLPKAAKEDEISLKLASRFSFLLSCIFRKSVLKMIN